MKSRKADDFDGLTVNVTLDEDGDWLAHFVELPGISAYAETPDQAVTELRLAWEAVKESYRQHNESIPVGSGRVTLASNGPRIIALKVTEDTITAQLADGRTISVPLAWSWRLANATPEQRQRFEMIGSGEGVHWPDLDEDLSAHGMLQGVPARPPKPKKVEAKRRRA
jgi:predicted RNase H-like HicB family nuclease